MKKICKSIVVVFLCALLVGIPCPVAAAEKTIEINMDQSYKNCMFTFDMEFAGKYDIELTSPSGTTYVCEAIDNDTYRCEVATVNKGKWIAVVKCDNDEVGLVSVTVNRKKDEETTVVDTIKVGKDISGLEMYLKDRTVVVNWLDDTCGKVNARITNIENAQILFSETISEQGFSYDVAEGIDNITVSIVPASSANITGAEITYSISMENTVDANVLFPENEYINQEVVQAEVTTGEPYGFLVVNNEKEVLANKEYSAGTYYIDIPLVYDGANEVRFYLVKEDGNMVSFAKTFIKDVVGPELVMEAEYDGLETYEAEVVVNGKVKNYNSITVNDSPIAVATDGYFSHTCSLHAGENLIEVKAIDLAGNVTSYNCNIVMLEKENDISVVFAAGLSALAMIMLFVASRAKKKRNTVKKKERIKKTKNTEKTDKIKKKEKVVSKKSFNMTKLYKYINFGLFAFAYLYILLFVISVNHIPTASMEPAVMANDMCISNRLAYVRKEPQAGDVIIFEVNDGQTLYCKRIVAVGGDMVTFKNGYVYINGEQLDESAYLGEDVETNCLNEFEVPDGHVFCLGDNREVSYDARYWEEPYVNVDDIVGKVMFVIPLNALYQ